MTPEDGPEVSAAASPTTVHEIEARSRAGFVAGFLLGVLIGGGVALLFAPERGERTRSRLRRRIQSFREDALEGIDDASSRTRAELQRRRRRLKEELEQIRERAKARAEEIKKSRE
jgi:gas vesicle protein